MSNVEPNGRWRLLAQSLMGIVLAMIMGGMGMVWNEIREVKSDIRKVAERQDSEMALIRSRQDSGISERRLTDIKHDAEIGRLDRRVELFERRVELLERRR